MSSTSNLRKRLDALIQNGKTIKRSAETTSAWRSLQMSKAWLGKAASYQGNGSIVDTAKVLDAEPYLPASTADGIPPTSNVSTEAPPLADDHLANVNIMRDQIQSEIESIEGLMPTEPRQRHCYQKSLDHLVEAKMWYGFELAELREAEQQRSINEAVAGAKFDGETGTDYVIKEKISENENKGSKKEQQGAPDKKG